LVNYVKFMEEWWRQCPLHTVLSPVFFCADRVLPEYPGRCFSRMGPPVARPSPRPIMMTAIGACWIKGGLLHCHQRNLDFFAQSSFYRKKQEFFLQNPVVTTIDNPYRGPYNIGRLSARKKVILGAIRVIHATRLKTLLRGSLWTPRS